MVCARPYSGRASNGLYAAMPSLRWDCFQMSSAARLERASAMGKVIHMPFRPMNGISSKDSAGMMSSWRSREMASDRAPWPRA